MDNKLFNELEDQLNEIFVEKQEIIRGLLIGLLSQEHVLLIGPKGSAKSEIAECICQSLEGKYFRRLLDKSLTPDEIFGPHSLKGLENDQYRRVVKGKLPEADVAFLDEIFKCNSATLNSMLTCLNERVYFNESPDGSSDRIQIPLKFAVGASNEMPESKEELGAFWDRFLLRYMTSYVKSPKSFVGMINSRADARNQPKLKVDPKKLRKSYDQALKDITGIKMTSPGEMMLSLKELLSKENIEVSDRRWIKCMKIVAAEAWLNGHPQVEKDDYGILIHSLWEEPEQYNTVKRLMLRHLNPSIQAVADLRDEAFDIMTKCMNADSVDQSKLATEANTKLKVILKKLDKIKGEKKVKNIDETIQEVADWNKQVVDKCLLGI